MLNIKVLVTAWLRVFWDRHAVIALSTLFIVLGGLAVVWAQFYPDHSWSSTLQNLGTEFFGGVILLIAFAAVEKKMRRQPGVPYAQMRLRLREASDRFRLLTTFSYLFVHRDDIDRRLSSVSIVDCSQALTEAITKNKGFRAEILLLDPNSHAAKQRAADRSDVDVIHLIWSNISLLSELQDRHGINQLDVRIYSSMPRVSLFQIDSYLSVSFFERNISISAADRSDMHVSEPTAKFFLSAFTQLWTDTATVSLKEFLRRSPAPVSTPQKPAEGVTGVILTSPDMEGANRA